MIVNWIHCSDHTIGKLKYALSLIFLLLILKQKWYFTLYIIISILLFWRLSILHNWPNIFILCGRYIDRWSYFHTNFEITILLEIILCTKQIQRRNRIRWTSTDHYLLPSAKKKSLGRSSCVNLYRDMTPVQCSAVHCVINIGRNRMKITWW